MRKYFAILCFLLAAGTLWSAEKLLLPKLSCSGQPGSVLNAAVPFMSNFTITGSPHKKPLAQTHVKMFHDNKYIYVGIKADEPYMNKLQASAAQAAYAIWNNDSVEFNFDPDGGNRVMGKIIVDTLGNVADFYGLDDNTGNDRFILERCRKSYTRVISLEKKSGHWSAELAIPFGIFYDGSKKTLLTPRINISRSRYPVTEYSSLFPMDRPNNNFPRQFKAIAFQDFNASEYGYAVEGLSIKSSKQAGKFIARVNAKVINPAKRFRNLKAVARLLDRRGNTIAANSTIFAALPGKLANVAVPLEPQKIGKCKLEFALQELSGALLSCQTMEVDLAYSPISIKVTEPCYRNNIYATMPPVKTVKAQIILAEKINTPLTATLSGPGYLHSVTIPSPKAVNNVEFPFENSKIGSYTLEVNGVKTIIRKLAYQPQEVWFDKKGIAYVDGKKFLPFGQCYSGDDWKTRGVNVTLSPAIWKNIPQTLAYLDKMHQNGIKVKLYPYLHPRAGETPFDNAGRAQGKVSPRQKELLVEFVSKVSKHPAVLAWYMADEPEGWGHNEDWYVDALKIMQEIDPYHPAIITNYGIAGQKRFYAGCDVLYPDTYPNYYQDNTTALGRRSTYEHITHASALRPSWQVLHGFDWGKLNSNNSHSRAPDYDELRQQLYSSFLGNAKGVTYFAANTWGCYSYQLRIGKDHLGPEVDSLQDFLLEDTIYPVKFNGIDERDFLCGVKRYGSSFIIIAVNLSAKECKVSFSSQLPLPRELKVVGEKRSIATSSNTFADTFKPHTTHVYAAGNVESDAVNHEQVRQLIRQADLDRKRPGNLAAAERELSLSEIRAYDKIPLKGARLRCSSEIALHRPEQNTQYFLQDGIRFTQHNDIMTWTPDYKDPDPYVEIDFGKVVTVSRSVIYSGGNAPFFTYLRGGELQTVDEQGNVKTVARFANNNKQELTVTFAPVKTRKLRLKITDYTTRGRLLHEWEVYEK